MIVKLVEIIRTSKFMSENGSLSKENYILREVFVNPDHVVCLREDGLYKKLLMEGHLLDDLDENQSFTKVYLNRGQSGIELTIVGEPSSVQKKLGLATQKQLLRG